MAVIAQTTQSSRRSLAAGLLTGVCLLSAVVLSRRAAGAASSLSSAWAACLIAAVVMAIGVASVVLFERRSTSRGTPERLLKGGLSLLPGLVLGLALLPASSAAGLVAMVGIFATLLGAAVGRYVVVEQVIQPSVLATEVEPSTLGSGGLAKVDSHSASFSPAKAEQGCSFESSKTFEAMPNGESPSFDGENTELNLTAEFSSHPSADPHVVQWLTRAIREEQELLEGGLKVHFPAGVKQVALHLPFAPAFDSLPAFDVEPLDDANVEIVVTSLHAYGVRLEVRRKSPYDQDQLVQIGYSAALTAEQSAAA